jgi:hypothetical protein
MPTHTWVDLRHRVGLLTPMIVLLIEGCRADPRRARMGKRIARLRLTPRRHPTTS